MPYSVALKFAQIGSVNGVPIFGNLGGTLSVAGTPLSGGGTVGPLTFTGSVFYPPFPSLPGAGPVPLDAATATQAVTVPASLPTLNFGATAQRLNPASLLITAVRPPSPAIGDVARFVLPDTWPSTLTFIDLPPIDVTTEDINGTPPTSSSPTATGLQTLVGSSYPIPTRLRNLAKAASLAAGLPWFDPVSFTINTITFATTGTPGTATVTAAGTLLVSQSAAGLGVPGILNFFFGQPFVNASYTVNIVVTLAAGPSHDSTNPARIVSLDGSTISVGSPSFPNVVMGIIKDDIQAHVLSQVETNLNASLLANVVEALASVGELPPTAVISAFSFLFSATVSPIGPPIGASLSIIVAAFPVLKNLTAEVTPAPVVGTSTTYVVTLTDTATGAPVAGLNAVIANYKADGTPHTEKPTSPNTDSQGRATFQNIALNRGKQTVLAGTGTGGSHGIPIIYIVPAPMLVVTDPAGVFAVLQQKLLKDELLT